MGGGAFGREVCVVSVRGRVEGALEMESLLHSVCVSILTSIVPVGLLKKALLRALLRDGNRVVEDAVRFARNDYRIFGSKSPIGVMYEDCSDDDEFAEAIQRRDVSQNLFVNDDGAAWGEKRERARLLTDVKRQGICRGRGWGARVILLEADGAC